MYRVIFLCVIGATAIVGLPSRRSFYSDDSPGAYMIGGYYKHPQLNRDYFPSMSSFVTKDLVATNTFAGLPQDPSWNTDTKEEYTEQSPVVQNIPDKTPDVNIEEDSSSEGATPINTNNNNNNNNNKWNRKGKNPSKPQDEGEDAPWWLNRSGSPSFTSFFPINIGGGGGAGQRRRLGNSAEPQDENEIPYSSSGSATAIANSFSTGKGGVATSHATSFGDPYLAAMFLRNGLYNVKGQGQRSGATK